MPALLIETSSERAMAALVEKNKLLFQADLPFGFSSSKFLIPEVERGLNLLSLKIKDLDFVAVGTGPGSYTGLRVGAAAAKTFAFACRLPLVGICSLETFLPTKPGPFAVLMDAKVSGAYLLLPDLSAGKVLYPNPPAVVPLEKTGSLLADIPTLVTPNAARLRPQFDALYPGNRWTWEESAPDALHMTSLAADKMRKGEYSTKGDLELMYLRHPS